METTVRTFRTGSLKQRTSQPLLPYADSPSHSSGKTGGKAFSRQQGSTCSFTSILTAVLVTALLGGATVAFTGVPGYVQPGFKRVSKKPAAAHQTAGDSEEPLHWPDYAGDDHEERAEQALLDRQIRLERELSERRGGRVGSGHHHEKARVTQPKQRPVVKPLVQQTDPVIDHDAVDQHAAKVAELARELEVKQQGQQQPLKEKAVEAAPEHLLASIAKAQKEVLTPEPLAEEQPHADASGQQQQEQHQPEVLKQPQPTPAPEPVPTPAPVVEAASDHVETQQAAADPVVPVKDPVVADHPVVATGIYALSARDKDDVEVPLSKYAGKVTVVVNVASQCGYTSQNYRGLVKLYEEYKGRGFEVLAFPCNAFGGQEPGSCSEVQHFAAEKFDATFPIFNKIEVNGPNTHPVFKFLKDHTPLGHGGGADVEWNFAKWVVNKKGYPVVRYPSLMDLEALRGWVEYELAQK